jgi:hypothetical protein
MEEESRARRERREYSGKGAQDGSRDVCEAAYVSIRQRTSADVSKAYVSIRQHTSGALRTSV